RPRRPQYSCFSTLPPSPSTMVLRWVASASTCCALMSWRAIRRCSYRAIRFASLFGLWNPPRRDAGPDYGSRGAPDIRLKAPKGPPRDRSRHEGGAYSRRAGPSKSGQGRACCAREVAIRGKDRAERDQNSSHDVPPAVGDRPEGQDSGVRLRGKWRKKNEAGGALPPRRFRPVAGTTSPSDGTSGHDGATPTGRNGDDDASDDDGRRRCEW